MPAQAGIQGRERMETGFRRYDETFVPSRGPEPTCTCIFEGGTELTEFRIVSNRNRFTPHPRGDSSGNLITGDPIRGGRLILDRPPYRSAKRLRLLTWPFDTCDYLNLRLIPDGPAVSCVPDSCDASEMTTPSALVMVKSPLTPFPLVKTFVPLNSFH